MSFAKEENKFLLLPIAPFTVYLEERDGGGGGGGGGEESATIIRGSFFKVGHLNERDTKKPP